MRPSAATQALGPLRAEELDVAVLCLAIIGDLAARNCLQHLLNPLLDRPVRFIAQKVPNLGEAYLVVAAIGVLLVDDELRARNVLMHQLANFLNRVILSVAANVEYFAADQLSWAF